MSEPAWDIAVIGAGAAGLMAALRAAELDRRVVLLEKNRRAGVKILMSGGTRCNITHATDNRGIVEAYGPPGRFLHSALAAFSVQDAIDFFEAEGVATKVEETGKIFPVSNRAVDVLDALLRRLHRSGAALDLGEPAIDLERTESGFVITTPGRSITAGRAILTTGGQSYPGSGTTGDGFRFAAKFGHTIVPPRPALVPITVAVPWVNELRGVTLPDIAVRVVEETRTLAARRGSLLFAHFGLSGPVILDVSRVVSGHARPESLALEIDLLPSAKEADLDEFLRRESLASGKKQLAVVLGDYLPRRLCDALLPAAGMPADRRAAALSKPERARLVQSVKRLRLPVKGTLGFGKAEVTAGGVALDEVDSRSMRSKKVSDLFLAGEVLDLDGPIGGYNFQAAWSTGWLAGTKAAEWIARMTALPLLPATVIGSWSFPGWYAKFCDDAARHPDLFGADDREEALRDAVRLAVDDQLRAGADLITDGEMQRVDFNLGFYDYLGGVVALPPARCWGPPAHDQRSRYRCTGPLAAPKGLGLIAEYRRLRTITDAPVKVPVPGPYTLAGCVQGGDVYPDRRAVAEALLPIVNRELRALVREGVTFLQLDEPSFACHPDRPEEFLDIIARTVEGITVPVSLHMCFGNYRGRAVGHRSYRPLFPHLARAKVSQLALEFASREMAEVELAREIKAPMGLAAGLVDVKNTWAEPPELVAERLRTVLKYIEPERVHVTPDCGFSQTARFIAVRKLTSMAQGVRLVRKELKG